MMHNAENMLSALLGFRVRRSGAIKVYAFPATPSRLAEVRQVDEHPYRQSRLGQNDAPFTSEDRQVFLSALAAMGEEYHSLIKVRGEFAGCLSDGTQYSIERLGRLIRCLEAFGTNIAGSGGLQAVTHEINQGRLTKIAASTTSIGQLLRYCRNVREYWTKPGAQTVPSQAIFDQLPEITEKLTTFIHASLLDRYGVDFNRARLSSFARVQYDAMASPLD